MLTFTNAIAEIVHSNVHFWRGACNKNLGNAFVLLWRIGDEEELLASYGGGGRHMTKRASLSQSMAQLGTNRSGKLSTGGTTVGESTHTHRGRINSVNSNLGGLEPEVRTIDLMIFATTTTRSRTPPHHP